MVLISNKATRVLIVEDDPPSCQLLQEMLSQAKWGIFEFKTESSLSMALDRLEKDSFDAVLLDLNLPDSVGLSTLNRVLDLYSDVPVVVITGVYDEVFGFKVVSSGAKQFLVKGTFDKNALNKAIMDAIELKNIERELEQKIAELGESVKGLKDQSSMFEVLERSDISQEEMFKNLLDLIPSSWPNGGAICAKIGLNEQEFRTSHFSLMPWKISSVINVYGEEEGVIEIYFSEKRESIKEEKNLLDVITALIVKAIEQRRDKEALKKTRQMLYEKKTALEQKDVVLTDIMNQVESKAKMIEENVMVNITHVIMPLIKQIKLSGKNQKQCELLEIGLNSITNAFVRKILDTKIKLSPREIEICNMVKSGIMSKDIARVLGISHQTVERHRRNIRKKLDVTNKDINLTTYLQGL